ncbi:MAG TPA: mercuric reductase [Ramlibacter sp.]|jgi:pyruvate/2-oxoglutarate dehydrogenase complex dihydrolipoamide dehydrogenase (E3) component|nr:mercuric reductase [Ramlibacter sp.]
MAVEDWDAIVVGAGQAGPALAVRLAGAGYRTALIERGRVGGTCVHTGCTPTKTLVAAARVAALARRAGEFGITLPGPVAVDFGAVRARVQAIVGQSLRGLESWLQGTQGLSVVSGHARFIAPGTLQVPGRTLRAPRVFLNVGCRPTVPAWVRDAGVPFLTSDNVFGLQQLPQHLAIVGAGAIGLEFAQVFRRLGSQVTVLEQGAALLPREDPEAAAEVGAALAAEGVVLELGADNLALARAPGCEALLLTFRRAGTSHSVQASHVLVATGRQPNTGELGLEQAGVALDERGFVRVDGQLRTSVPGIWALGDVNGRGAFTHTAWNDYEVVAANLLDGQARSVDERVSRYALYVDPPLARIGDSEQQARARGSEVLVGFLPMSSVGRARERGETRGFMKVLVDAASMQLLGATLVCADADEIIHSLVALMAADVDVRRIASSVPIHPTISELIPTMLQRLMPLQPTASPA